MEANDYVRFGKRKGTIVAVNGNTVTVRPKYSKKFLELKTSKVTVIDYEEFKTSHRNPRPKKKNWPKAKTNRKKPVVISEQERIEKTIVKTKYPNITETKVSQRQIEVAEQIEETFCEEYNRIEKGEKKEKSIAMWILFLTLLGLGVIYLAYWINS